MSAKDIPLFEYAPERRVSGSVYRIFQQWREYVYKYFLPEGESASIHQVKKALDYHLENLKTPLSHKDFDNWCCIVNECRMAFKPTHFMGVYIRRFYEASEKSDQDRRVTQTLLNSCTNTEDDIDFVCLQLDNYGIFDYFYNDVYEVMDMYFHIKHDSGNHNTRKKFAYLSRYVYTSNFVENYPNFSSTQFIGQTEDLIPKLSEFMYSTFESERTRLEFLVSVLYVVDKAILEKDIKDKVLESALNVKTAINELFEHSYPESYVQYNTLHDLGISMTPYQIAGAIEQFDAVSNISLPELG